MKNVRHFESLRSLQQFFHTIIWIDKPQKEGTFINWSILLCFVCKYLVCKWPHIFINCAVFCGDLMWRDTESIVLIRIFFYFVYNKTFLKFISVFSTCYFELLLKFITSKTTEIWNIFHTENHYWGLPFICNIFLVIWWSSSLCSLLSDLKRLEGNEKN